MEPLDPELSTLLNELHIVEEKIRGHFRCKMLLDDSEARPYNILYSIAQNNIAIDIIINLLIKMGLIGENVFIEEFLLRSKSMEEDYQYYTQTVIDNLKIDR